MNEIFIYFEKYFQLRQMNLYPVTIYRLLLFCDAGLYFYRVIGTTSSKGRQKLQCHGLATAFLFKKKN